MSERSRLYDRLAGLLEYPRHDVRDRIARSREEIGRSRPEAVPMLDRFEEQIRALSPEDLEELFTRTFDLNPAASLDVGWHLYGESYERGRFLVWVRGELRRLGLAETTELPDHLTHVLAALGRMDPSSADRFAAERVLPAIRRMLKGLESKGNPYENVLLAIASVLEASHGVRALWEDPR